MSGWYIGTFVVALVIGYGLGAWAKSMGNESRMEERCFWCQLTEEER